MTGPSLLGKTVKHYQIETLLGKGGMGEVYRARDTRLQRPVAVKILKSELTSDPHRRQRFLQEARAAAALTHPAIAQIYDVDEQDGVTFIAMEFVEGQTISQLIANRELDLLGSVEIACQVAEGLGRAHKAHTIHRDIKSDNIMVTSDGHAKLLDFGLAKLLEPDQDAPEGTALDALTHTLTQTIAGTVMGTIAYMSPEQARGQSVDQRSDIFSLGIVLYEMVAGELPFKGESPLDTMHAIAFDEARPVTVVRKNLPPQLHRIISRCLRKRVEDRYADAEALASDLKTLKQELESGIQRPLSPRERLEGMFDWIKTSLPFGVTGLIALILITALVVIVAFTNITWASVIWTTIIALFIYRYIKNRKSRMLKGFVTKVSRFRAVLAIRISGDRITVIVDKAQAALYIRINSLLDSLNQKLYFGKPLEVAIVDNLPADEFQSQLRETGIVYVRDDVLLERPQTQE